MKFIVFHYEDGGDPWRFGNGADFVGSEVEAKDAQEAAEKAWGESRYGGDLTADEQAAMFVIPVESATLVEITGVVKPKFQVATPAEKPSTAKRRTGKGGRKYTQKPKPVIVKVSKP